MPVTEAFLFDAAWLFLAGWTAVVLAVNLIAFRGDFRRALGQHPGLGGHSETTIPPIPPHPAPETRPKTCTPPC
jgi:hypothetical protein